MFGAQRPRASVELLRKALQHRKFCHQIGLVRDCGTATCSGHVNPPVMLMSSEPNPALRLLRALSYLDDGTLNLNESSDVTRVPPVATRDRYDAVCFLNRLDGLKARLPQSLCDALEEPAARL